MNSQARRLRRKSVLRSVLSVHAAYRAVPFRPARMASLCSAPRTASACSRFRVPGVVIRSPFPAYFLAFPPSFCSSAPDYPPASGSLTHRITPALRFTLTHRRTFPFRLCSRHSLRLQAQARRARRNSASSPGENFLPGVRLFPVPSPFIPIRQ